MGKKKRKTTTPTTSATAAGSDLLNIDDINLRTAGPVTRVRGAILSIGDRLMAVKRKITAWGCEDANAATALELLNEMTSRMPAIRTAIEKLELTGYSPSRKAFTSRTEEGDHVSILPKYRAQYKDLLPEDHMADLTVIRKNPDRGGLILESSEGARLKTASAHVVRLPQVE
jgi:hypothetical protein